MTSRLKMMLGFLVITGLIVGPSGLLVEMPKVSAIGYALFLAGFFSPVYLTKKLSKFDGIFGGICSASIFHFTLEGAIDYWFLLLFFPLFFLCILVSKWTKTEF